MSWHIIKVDCTELASPASLTHLLQFILQQEDAPCILLSHSATSDQLDLSAIDTLAQTLDASLNEKPGHNYDASHLLQFTSDHSVDWEKSGQNIENLLSAVPENGTPIIKSLQFSDSPDVDFLPGIAGEYEAAIFCRLLSASKLTLIGSSPGIWSANPDCVQDAFILKHLSMIEAAEVAYANAGMLHPQSLALLDDLAPTIQVRSLDAPSFEGTIITKLGLESEQLAKAVTAQSGLALIVIEGLGMMGIPGITAHAFGALASEDINIVLLSQASTEQSIGIVIDQDKKDAALTLLKDAFHDKLAKRKISRIYVIKSVGVVTVVDDQMRYRLGLTGKMFSALGRSGINVIAIADGASENNISAVVAGEDLPAAALTLHETFCFGRRIAHVFMFGAGTIGGKLLKLMREQSQKWLSDLNLKICLVGLSNSKHMIWDKAGIAFEKAIPELKKAEQPLDLKAIVNHLINSRLDRMIVIDATASDEIADLYPTLMDHNIAVVTPNKRANTKSVAHYQKLQTASRNHQVPYFYETTVGAGLPIISTLRDLIRSGDEILRIEGVVSGTLSYIFNNMGKGLSFADALQNAYDHGYTEPDPRDDLSGEDIARKMLILAREAGIMVEREKIQLTPLLSPDLMQMPRDQFMEEFATHLADWSPPITLQPGQQMCFIGRIEYNQIHIGVQAVDKESAFASLQGTDNMIIFTTKRYFDTPLIVRGPGAGPAVTAGGVLADLIKAAELVT